MMYTVRFQINHNNQISEKINTIKYICINNLDNYQRQANITKYGLNKLLLSSTVKEKHFYSASPQAMLCGPSR